MIAEKSNQELRDDCALDYFQDFVEPVRGPINILDSARRVTQASRTAVSLTICRQIVDRRNGTIATSSTPEDATFVVTVLQPREVEVEVEAL